MTHVVTSACVRCKYQDCVHVCPVEAFREAEEYLVIDKIAARNTRTTSTIVLQSGVIFSATDGFNLDQSLKTFIDDDAF